MEIKDQFNLDQKPGRTALVNGKELLFFSGYNYLGINNEPEFNKLLLEGADKYGWLFPSSRISNTRLAIYEECEALLSELTGTEDTVLFSSGFAAGQAIISCYKNSINNAPHSHPAILQNRSEFDDFELWKQQLIQQTNTDQSTAPTIFASDSVNPLTAAVHDFSFLKEASRSVSLILDDSHGIGILGKNGNGVSACLSHQPNLTYTFTYSLSKAFGIQGGAVSCSKTTAHVLRKLPAYTAVTPLSPAQVYAFVKGQYIYAQQRQKLFGNICYFADLIKNFPEIKFDANFPVFILPQVMNERFFYQQNILISSFAYPDPAGKKLNRLVINALHTQKDLDKLAEVVSNFYPIL